MRIVIIMVGLIGFTAWAGYAVRKRDAIASALLFAIGALFGWFGK